VSTILNKNTDGTRTVPLGERELAQELTPNDKDYGKIIVGTDGTLEGEVLLAKDEDVSNLSASNFVSSGVINKKDDTLIFNEVVGNEYKMANTDRFVNFDGKVIDTYGPELVTNGDFSDGTTGWSTSNSILSNENGILKVYRADSYGISGTPLENVGAGSSVYISASLFNVMSGNSIYIRYGSTTAILNQELITTSSVRNLSHVLKYDNAYICVLTGGSTTAYVDNISVREITTVDMTNDMPEVTIQDQAEDGLVVQSSVNAGDYVVVPDLADGMDSVSSTGVSISGNTATYSSSPDGAYARADDYIYMEEGQTLLLTADITSYTSGTYFIGYSSGTGTFTSSNTATYTSIGRMSRLVTCTTSGTIIPIVITAQVGGTATIENISSSWSADIYRAKQDFPDSYNPATTPISVLDTDYFEDRTQFGITNKILATMRNDGTIKTEVCFVDTAIEDCGNAHVVMTDNGYSKLNNGLYSKDGDIVTPIGTWAVSNSGNFHEVYNYFGMYADINDDIGVRSSLLNSTADCFNPANIGTAIGHPQGIDKSKYVTADQWIDLRIEANAVSEQDELNRVGTKAKSGQLDGIGGVVATYRVETAIDCVFNLNEGDSWYLNGNVFGVAGNSYIFGSNDLDGHTFYVEDDNGIYHKAYKAYYYLSGTRTRFWMDGTPNATFTNAVLHNVYYTKTKTLPIPSSGTYNINDWIGDPNDYPQYVKDRLASGLPIIGANPLLVDDSGNSLIPDGTSKEYKVSSKALVNHTFVVTTDGGNTYGAFTWGAIVGTSNSHVTNALSSGDVAILSYTAKIPTTQVTDPKPVKLVGNYVTATNSHSVYKGNQLVPTGKVNIGGSLESRLLDNTLIGVADRIIVAGEVNQGCDIGDTVIFYGFDSYNDGVILERLYSDYGGGTLLSNYDLTNTQYWKYIGSLSTTPIHSTIALDTEDSPAVKFIETIAEDDDGMAHYQMFAQEMVWDYDVDYDNIIEKNGSIAQTYIAGNIYRITAGSFAGMIIVCTNGATTALDGVFNLVGNDLVTEATNVKRFELWDGNGFGDDNQFTQLTNGILTDDNANTVKTVVASIPLNKYIGA
jgi:hypothetical protein